jgi:4-hydroxybutyrate dehydrogenase/sulfolactaldehyde 3-reductase
MATVGLIGLGLMGRGMARNLLAGGHALTVYDLEPAAVAAGVGLGARSAASPREVGAASEVVFTVLPDAPQVREVVLGPDGVLAGAAAGTLVADCSTIDPAASRAIGAEVAARGGRFVDAAMGRSSKEAEAGTLVFMVGAEPDDLARLRPLLEAMGSDIFHCGPPGSGITVKLVNNLLGFTILAADVEALVLAAKAGVDLAVLMTVLSATASSNTFLDTVVRSQVLTGDYTPGFKASFALKDATLAQNMAARLGMPLLALEPARQLWSVAVGMGEGERAHGVIAEVLARLHGVELASGRQAPP